MKIITSERAIELLENAYTYHPGKWRDHSCRVGEAALTIAQHLPGMDAQRAYCYGLLHDIGRIRGKFGMRHVYDGYQYMMEMGYADVANICLTHSFVTQQLYEYNGVLDCSDEEVQFLTMYLERAVYDDYDKLIQLCDALAMPQGFCILERRLIDVAIRNGINAYSIEKWRGFLALKDDVDARCGMNIYHLFDIAL